MLSNRNHLAADFAMRSFIPPSGERLFYRFDKDTIWHKLNEDSVNLSTLQPGNYILHVTGSNDNGVINPTGDRLCISILQPFYDTWWFRVLVIGIAGLVIIEIRRRGIKRIRQEETLRTELNKQLAKAEIKALRAQMNPHFIFNCLNSINSFVMDQKHDIASDYLIKFSKLIRLILDNSRSDFISVDKELEALKLYVLLESARFEDKFRCNFLIDEKVNTSSMMIPPMLLQPFVENAIWHGLMQKEGEGIINVIIKKESDEMLKVIISDNGIGRKKATELNSKSVTHKSHGMKVTELRIQMMNKLNSTGAQVLVSDLYDEIGRPSGTSVELTIPV